MIREIRGMFMCVVIMGLLLTSSGFADSPGDLQGEYTHKNEVDCYYIYKFLNESPPEFNRHNCWFMVRFWPSNSSRVYQGRFEFEIENYKNPSRILTVTGAYRFLPEKTATGWKIFFSFGDDYPVFDGVHAYDTGRLSGEGRNLKLRYNEDTWLAMIPANGDAPPQENPVLNEQQQIARVKNQLPGLKRNVSMWKSNMYLSSNYPSSNENLWNSAKYFSDAIETLENYRKQDFPNATFAEVVEASIGVGYALSQVELDKLAGRSREEIAEWRIVTEKMEAILNTLD